MTGRFGQLAYTSFDAVGSAGGWQVKETSGELTPDETQLLIAGVRTVFRTVQPTLDYPTPEQLERGPRRLAYQRVEGGGAGLWHTFPAGSDSTGRPGNVFAHALLDRAPDLLPRSRAIEWWRSEHWLRPYGAAAVSRAGLPLTAPAPGSAVTRDSVIQFVLDPDAWRLATLFGLLDAVAAALAGGPRVVLGTESADSAAQWIGVVSFLMSPGTAAQLSFSTFDRADQLSPQSEHVLSAVPTADLDAVPAGMVTLGESETLSLGELGGEPHRTVRGDCVQATAWSAMAQVALLDGVSARRVLDDIDTVATQVRDDGLHPAWPLAMAVVGHEEFADAQPEAHDVITRHSPAGVAVGSVAAFTIADVLAAAVGATTAEAWRAVQELPAGPAAAHADATYLSRAIADPDWLAQDGPIPLGPRPFHGKPTPRSVHAAIGSVLAGSHAPERLLRIADLLTRSGIDDDRLPAALVDGVVPHLADDGLRRRIDAESRLMLGAALLRGDTEGRHIGDDLLDWLVADTPQAQSAALAQALPWDPVWTGAALRGVRTGRRGPLDAGDRGAQLWWVRMSGAERFEGFAAAQVWDPVDLLLAAGDGTLPGTSALRTLIGAPDSAAMSQLAAKVIDGNGDSSAVACAAVRHIEPWDWMLQRYVQTHQPAYIPFWDDALAAVEPGGVHADFAVRLLTFGLLGVLAGQPYPHACEELAADAGPGDQAVARVLPMVDGRQIEPRMVAAISLLRAASAEATHLPLGAVDTMVAALAERVAVTMPDDENEIDGVTVLMAQMSGDSSEGALRGYRRMVSRLLGRRGDPHTSPSMRRWGAH
ncbi:GAP1-N2 domain-containing protein [Mycobacterium sp. NPDC003449]